MANAKSAVGLAVSFEIQALVTAVGDGEAKRGLK